MTEWVPAQAGPMMDVAPRMMDLTHTGTRTRTGHRTDPNPPRT